MRLETDRLILRSWKLSDFEPYALIVADPEVMKHIGDGRVQSPEQAELFIRKMMEHEENRGWILWALEHKQSGALMGFCGFGLLDEQLDFGWRLGRKFWGQGYGTEAACAALAYGIATWGFKEIRAVAYADNRASIRIMEKAGMIQDGTGTRNNRTVVYYFHRARPAGGPAR